MRLDLNGDPVGRVSAQAAAHAVELLDAHHKHWRVAIAYGKRLNAKAAKNGNGAAEQTAVNTQTTETSTATTTTTTKPRPAKITLADLRAAARERQAAQ